MLGLWSICLLVVAVDGVSNGALPICDTEMSIGKGTSIMKWVQAPTTSNKYTITAGGATSYSPGGITPITITVLDLDYVYIGLLLVAISGTNNSMSGKWTVLDGDDFFLPASCKFGAVAHANANLKGLTHTFYWQGSVGMGPVTFRALIKQGEQNHGSFFKPATLVLQEGTPVAPQAVWKGVAGASCDETCGAQGQACDQTATLALSTASTLQASVRNYYPCRTPYLSVCAPPVTGKSSFCYYSNCTSPNTFVAANTCSRRSGDPNMNQPFCACKPGTVIRDPQPPETDAAALLGLELREPLQLDSQLTINSVRVVDEIVTIDISGPQDRWFAVGWNASYMNGAYSTVIWLDDPTIKPPQRASALTFQGYRDSVRGWYDVNCQQALNDFCRNIGDPPTIWFSCAVANSTAQNTYPYNASIPDTYSVNLSSRVPCKNGKIAPYLPMSVVEYKLTDTPSRGAVRLPSTTTTHRATVSGGQFRIVFSRNISGDNPFPVQENMNLIWSLGEQQYFGPPLGSGAFLKHISKSESSIVLKLRPIRPVCSVSAAPATLPSMLLLGGLAALSGKSWVAFGVLLAALIPPATAHNWVNNPSRATIAAVNVPCQERVDPAPHLQVSPGQTFELEWSTGHGDTPTVWTYWVFLKESSYNSLIKIQDADLDEYLDNAPSSALITGDIWTRRHLSPGDHYDPGCATCNNGSTIPGTFAKILKSGDANFITRNPVAVQKSLQKYHTNVTQFWYPTAQTAGDLRAQYTSAKYPWIISVHKFRVPNHWPDEYDMARFSFPTNVAPGNYIAHFKWGGYRDCTDVHITSLPTVPNPWGLVQSANNSAAFARLDHCQYTQVLNSATKCRVMTGTNASQCLAECLLRDGTFGCTGVQAVLKTNPPGTLPYTPNFPYKKFTKNSLPATIPPTVVGPCDSRTIHTRADCPDISVDCGDDEIAGPADSYICYGLVPYRDQDFQVAEDYTIATDPRDPGFYSTCWVRLGPGGFLPYPKPATPPVPWRVGEQCLSCDWIRDVLPTYDQSSAIPWKDGLTTNCKNCDVSLAQGCSDDSYVEDGNIGTCGQVANGATCDARCNPGFGIFGSSRVCENNVLLEAGQKCIFRGC